MMAARPRREPVKCHVVQYKLDLPKGSMRQAWPPDGATRARRKISLSVDLDLCPVKWRAAAVPDYT